MVSFRVDDVCRWNGCKMEGGLWMDDDDLTFVSLMSPGVNVALSVSAKNLQPFLDRLLYVFTNWYGTCVNQRTSSNAHRLTLVGLKAQAKS